MASEERITKTPGVCGGDACVRGTRITVWGLVESKRLGSSDDRLIADRPGLTQEHLKAAWAYAAANAPEIERALWLNEACMIEHDGHNVPIDFLWRGQQLGLTDEAINEAFEPPLVFWANRRREPPG